jgi:enoyl-CoA hydratase
MGVLEVTRAEGYLTITLDDPDKRNLLSTEMVDGLVGAMAAAEADEDVAAVIITGRGRAFCAGADVSKLGDQDREGLLHIYGAFLSVAASNLLTIAAVNGPAVGAGMNLALAADVRIAAESSRYDTRFLQIGLHPGGGHTWMLQRIVGPQVAAAMVLGGQVVSGPESVELGLSYWCVPDEELLDAARELAEGAARTPRGLLVKTKETMRRTMDVEDHDEAVAIELDAQLWSKAQPEFAERIAELRQRISSRP